MQKWLSRYFALRWFSENHGAEVPGLRMASRIEAEILFGLGLLKRFGDIQPRFGSRVVVARRPKFVVFVSIVDLPIGRILSLVEAG